MNWLWRSAKSARAWTPRSSRSLEPSRLPVDEIAAGIPRLVGGKGAGGGLWSLQPRNTLRRPMRRGTIDGQAHAPADTALRPEHLRLPRGAHRFARARPRGFRGGAARHGAGAGPPARGPWRRPPAAAATDRKSPRLTSRH